jgi:hypothetical protein
VLALKVAMEACEQDQHGDGDEGRAERLADAAQAVQPRVLRVDGDARVEPEKLRDGDADAREGERCAEPGEEGAFCPRPLV